MNEQASSFSRRAFAPELFFTLRESCLERTRGDLIAPKRGRRSAERRMPSTVRTSQCGSVLSGGRSPSGAPPRRSPGRTHPASAQLQFPRFLKPGCIGRYPLPPVSSLPRSAETGRSAGRAVARSRPGADCKSARGLRSRSVFRCASRTRPSREQDERHYLNRSGGVKAFSISSRKSRCCEGCISSRGRCIRISLE